VTRRKVVAQAVPSLNMEVVNRIKKGFEPATPFYGCKKLKLEIEKIENIDASLLRCVSTMLGSVGTEISEGRFAFTLQQYRRENFEYNQSGETRRKQCCGSLRRLAYKVLFVQSRIRSDI